MRWSKEAVQQRHRSLGSIMQGRQDLDLMVREPRRRGVNYSECCVRTFQFIGMSEGGMENSASRLGSFGRKLILSLPEVEDESPGRPFLEMLSMKFWKSCAGLCAGLCQACQCVSGRLARLTCRGS